jgi:hypothetical protein
VRPSRILLFAAIMLAEFAAFEAGLRLKGGSEAAPVFQQLFTRDAEVGLRLKPGARAHFKTASFETDIVINSSGTRDDDIGPKPPHERRIVVLGDSLVMAVQVQAAETFCARLQARLNADPPEPGARYRVINAGIQGYGPVEELTFFDKVARRFEPDLVLVALFVGNDAMEASDSGGALLPAPARAPAEAAAARPIARSTSPFPVWMRRVVRRSMVLQIVRLRGIALLDRFGQIHPVDRALTLYLPAVPPDMARGLAVTRVAVERIAGLAAAGGAKTAVLLVPARFQVDEEDYQNLKAVVADSGETLVRDAATDRFQQALAGLPIPVMDALPVLRAPGPATRVFFQDTAHLTVFGHQVLAAGIDRFLRASNLLVPPAAPTAAKGQTGGEPR